MPPETPGLYTDARIYDILHRPGTSREVDGLERIVRHAGEITRRPLTWLEPACGTGRYLVELARRGHRVLGFDRDPGMVAFARQRLRRPIARRKARVFAADLTAFGRSVKPGSVDVAFLPINTIRHLGSDAAMLRHLTQIKRVLRPGGQYIIGLGLRWYGFETPSEDVWEGRSGATRVKQIIEFIPARRGDRKEWAHSHLVIRRGRGAEEHRDSSYWLRAYSRGQWRGLLKRCGLALESVLNERGDPVDPGPLGYALYVLRKPATRR